MEHYLLLMIGFILVLLAQTEGQAAWCARDVNRIEKGRKCNLACELDSDCTGRAEKCICDDVCGKSCISLNTTCEALESPHFGYILGKQRKYDATVVYHCHSGYILNGPDHRRCRSDGKWSGITPKCLPFNTCGQSGDYKNRLVLKKVIRGERVEDGAWPWHVMLTDNHKNEVQESIGSMIGSGVIVNEHWVVTSAHLYMCFQNIAGTDWDHRLYVIAGLTKIPKAGETLPKHVQVYRAKEVIRHPKFNRDNNDYDICLIRIGARVVGGKNELFHISPNLPSYKFTFDENVRAICLPCVNEWQEDVGQHVEDAVEDTFPSDKCETGGGKIYQEQAVVTGFGGIKPIDQDEPFSVEKPSVLRQGFLDILPNRICREGVKRINKKFKTPAYTPRMICARGTNEKKLQDACRGDSGGPLAQKVFSEDGYEYWILTGVVSWGWGCANLDEDGFVFPGYYANVTSMVPWITDTISTFKEKWTDSGKPASVINVTVLYESDGKQEWFYRRMAVDVYSTIASLKQQIEYTFSDRNIPEYQQEIYNINGRLLPKRTLKSYGIKGNHRILVHVLSD